MKVTDKIEITNEDNMELMSRYPDNYFDLAIVDPPYGIGMGARKGRQSKGQSIDKFDKPKYKTSEWDSAIPEKEYFTELFRVSKNQIIWGGNYFTELLPVSRGWVFWDKKPILPNYSAGELAWTSFDCVLKRVVINWNGKIRTGIEKGYKSIHPTQKPIKLYSFLFNEYAKEGDKILDTHLGSGSIAIACHNLGFELTACELDKDYFEASIKRINNHIAQQRLF